jgi:hypothetical protein
MIFHWKDWDSLAVFEDGGLTFVLRTQKGYESVYQYYLIEDEFGKGVLDETVNGVRMIYEDASARRLWSEANAVVETVADEDGAVDEDAVEESDDEAIVDEVMEDEVVEDEVVEDEVVEDEAEAPAEVPDGSSAGTSDESTPGLEFAEADVADGESVTPVVTQPDLADVNSPVPVVSGADVADVVSLVPAVADTDVADVSSPVPVVVGDPADDDLPSDGLPGEDLPGYDLPGSDLPGEDLPGYDLPGSDLPGENLPGSGLPGDSELPSLDDLLETDDMPEDPDDLSELPEDPFGGDFDLPELEADEETLKFEAEFLSTLFGKPIDEVPFQQIEDRLEKNKSELQQIDPDRNGREALALYNELLLTMPGVGQDKTSAALQALNARINELNLKPVFGRIQQLMSENMWLQGRVSRERRTKK